jgi:hypothetical protein
MITYNTVPVPNGRPPSEPPPLSPRVSACVSSLSENSENSDPLRSAQILSVTLVKLAPPLSCTCCPSSGAARIVASSCGPAYLRVVARTAYVMLCYVMLCYVMLCGPAYLRVPSRPVRSSQVQFSPFNIQVKSSEEGEGGAGCGSSPVKSSEEGGVEGGLWDGARAYETAIVRM